MLVFPIFGIIHEKIDYFGTFLLYKTTAIIATTTPPKTTSVIVIESITVVLCNI